MVLLWRSIFDNAAYVEGGPGVISQRRDELPGWKGTLLAVDGDTLSGVGRQLQQLPADATHLVVSAGRKRRPRLCALTAGDAGFRCRGAASA